MRIRPATIIAALALLIAVTGTATAASGLIHGKKIKPGTVAGKAFKNKTITKSKISTQAIAALAGAQGPKGPKGQPGATGNQGAPGLPGTSSFSKTVTKVAQAPNVDVTQVLLDDLPGSRYIATAKVNVVSQTAGSTVECELQSGNGGGSDQALWTNPANNSRGVLWMVLPTQVQTNNIKVVCNSGASSATLKTTLTASSAK